MQRFWQDHKGNVAIMFALAVVPVVGAMGAALDYSMANSYRTDMQKALDSAALAVSKVMPLPQAELDKVAMQYFEASLGHHSLTNLKLTVVPDQGHARLHAWGDYTPGIASLLGIDKFEVGATSEARWGIGKVEVALVLDNSGSMKDHGRIGHLKKASHDLLQVLKDAAKDPDDAKVAIVPFDSAVRLPYDQTNAPNWIKWGHNGSCSSFWYGNQKNCLDNWSVWTWSVWQTNKWSSWGGCVEDRDKDPSLNHDVLDTAPDNTTSNSVSARQTRFPARPCDDNSLNTVAALNNNWGTDTSTDATTLHGKVNLMTPAGATNIGIGLAWGWHVLSPTEPYTEGKAYGTKDLTKYVVLMTDGDNTRNRYYSCLWSWGTCGIDTRTETVCTNIKNAGIQIFAVRLVEGNATLLKNCASNPGMYYDVQDASALSGVFKNIASQIASLHLSK